MAVNCIDLFCGAGGLTHGLIRKGINVSYGIDLDLECKFAFEYNNPKSKFISSDVNEISSDAVRNLFGSAEVRLLAGCAPCQPFSKYSRGKGKRNAGKWSLLKKFGELVNDIQPELVTMENVPELINHEVFEEFLENFKGYEISTQVINCYDYGIPQKRKRLVFMASKLGPIVFSPSCEISIRRKTVRDAIEALNPICSGERDLDDPIHLSSKLNDLNLKRIQASEPGGSWRDWPKELRLNCHNKDSGKGYGAVYGRMTWDEPAPTMTTLCYGYGNGRFGHPEQDRAISLREAALIQSFPKDYKFLDDGSKVKIKTIGRLIGNAVPVKLGEVIAESIYNHLKVFKPNMKF